MISQGVHLRLGHSSNAAANRLNVASRNDGPVFCRFVFPIQSRYSGLEISPWPMDSRRVELLAAAILGLDSCGCCSKGD